MSQIKRLIEVKEENKIRMLEGYRKMLEDKGIYDTDCPSCCNALSIYDTKKEQCRHCGYCFSWNIED